VIEAIDSSFWRVWVRDQAVVAGLRIEYANARDVDSEKVIPPADEES